MSYDALEDLIGIQAEEAVQDNQGSSRRWR